MKPLFDFEKNTVLLKIRCDANEFAAAGKNYTFWINDGKRGKKEPQPKIKSESKNQDSFPEQYGIP